MDNPILFFMGVYLCFNDHVVISVILILMGL